MPGLLIWMAAIAVIVIVIFRWNLLIRSFDWVFREKFHPWLEKNATLIGAYRSFGWFLAMPLAFVGAYLAYHQLMDVLRSPDVTLVFGRPNDPAFMVINPSAKLVKEPKYQIVLYSMSLQGDTNPYLILTPLWPF